MTAKLLSDAVFALSESNRLIQAICEAHEKISDGCEDCPFYELEKDVPNDDFVGCICGLVKDAYEKMNGFNVYMQSPSIVYEITKRAETDNSQE